MKKGSELTAASGAQTEGMTRINAITNMSDQIYGSGEDLNVTSMICLGLTLTTCQ